jgi:hypothetical protein
MTWIRVDTTLPTEPIIGELCERLGVDIPTAIGLHVCAQLGFADHRTDAMVDQVPNVSLEQWSYWGTVRHERPPAPGAFAEALRELCVQTEEGKRDPVGRFKGWWRQEALIRKQLADAARRKPGPRGDDPGSGDGGPPGGSPGEPPRSPPDARAGSRGNVVVVDGNENGKATTTTPAGSDFQPVDGLTYVRRVVGAVNKGLQENPSYGPGRSFNELTCSSQDIQQEWIREGIPVEVAERAVYERARKFRPSRTRPQPTTLRYFSRGVVEDWERVRARDAARGLEPAGAGLVLSEGEMYARSLETSAREDEVPHGT